MDPNNICTHLTDEEKAKWVALYMKPIQFLGSFVSGEPFTIKLSDDIICIPVFQSRESADEYVNYFAGFVKNGFYVEIIGLGQFGTVDYPCPMETVYDDDDNEYDVEPFYIMIDDTILKRLEKDEELSEEEWMERMRLM